MADGAWVENTHLLAGVKAGGRDQLLGLVNLLFDSL